MNKEDAAIVEVARSRTRERRNTHLRFAISELRAVEDDCDGEQRLLLHNVISDLRLLMESEVP